VPREGRWLGKLRCLLLMLVLEADSVMLEEVRSVLASAQGVIVEQDVRAGRDAYVPGRDMTVNRPGE
jgi:hypothetical protein